MTEPAVQVHPLSFGLAQAYLLASAGGMLLVDAGIPRAEGVVLRQMQRLGRDDLRLIFLTHAHWDHFGSAAALRRATGAAIAIHHRDAAALAAAETHLGEVRGRGHIGRLALPLAERLLPAQPAPADVLLDDGAELAPYGFGASLLHTPGHTPGSSTLLVGRLAFAGDLLSNSAGLHIQRYYAQDWTALPGSVRRLAACRPRRIYCGHGREAANGEELQRLLHTLPDV